jgi:hypothetical protein
MIGNWEIIRNEGKNTKRTDVFLGTTRVGVFVATWRLAFALLLTSWLALGSAFADDTADAKRHFLHDRAHAFLRNPELAAKLENQLRMFNAAQLPLHVVTATSTSFSKDLVVYSNDLRLEFLQDRDGFVLVYEVDSGRFNLSMRHFDEDVLKDNWKPSFVPQHLDMELRQQWSQRIKTKMDRITLINPLATYDPADSCSELAIALMETFGEFVQANPEPEKEFLPAILISFTMLGLFVFALILCRKINQKQTTKTVYTFPTASCKATLGAHHGGNAISSVKFNS